MIPTDPYRDPAITAGILDEITRALVSLGRPVTLMEVCGTHTHAVAAAGLRRLLPEGVRLISGPGCPVCVTPVDYLDRAVALARRGDTEVCTFGDLMRVPSSTTTLEKVSAEDGRVRVVYSPRDALKIAQRHPERRVVFLAVGFETTTPTIAAALAEAEATGCGNFQVLTGNKVVPPALDVLAEDERLEVQGFLLPGHVSVITGWEAFTFLAQRHGISGAVVGFTPTDVLRGVLEVIQLLAAGEPRVVNLYGRVVTAAGNTSAQALVDRHFETAPASWRGFGAIPSSGLALRPELRHRDAGLVPLELPQPVEPAGCRCGDVLRGLIDPPECPLFARGCTPETPVGACMVSSEGTCAAWYRHDRWQTGAAS